MQMTPFQYLLQPREELVFNAFCLLITNHGLQYRNMQKRHKTMILTLDHDDPEAELTFEIEHCLSLTTEERYCRMLSRSLQIAQELVAHGYKKTPLIVERS